MKFFKKLNKTKTYKFIQYSLSTFLILFLLSNIILKVDKIFAFAIENPIILNVQTVKKDGFTNHIYVSGLTGNETKVLIYIDGNYENTAQIIPDSNKELNRFEYYSKNPLPKGKHEIKIIAKNEALSGASSPISKNITIYKTIESYTDTNNTNTEKTNNNTIAFTPEIATPKNNQIFERNWIIISGLTSNNTKVNIFLNGKFIASTDFLTDSSGTASFSYKIENLQGNNKIYVQSETKKGILSKKSQEISFSIKKKKDIIVLPSIETPTKKANTPQIKNKENTKLTPIITINTPQNNSVITNKKLEISGQAQNTDQIEIFIDNIIVHQIKNKENILNFKYIYNKNLDDGRHITHIEVKNGDKIEKSKYINFIIASTTTSSNTKNHNNNGTTTKQKATTTPNQNNSSSNKIIFILFLMAIIIWMIIVNKNIILKKIKSKDNNKKIDNGNKINFEKPEESKKEENKNN